MDPNILVTALLEVVDSQSKTAASTMEKIHAIVEYYSADPRQHSDDPYAGGYAEVQRHQQWCDELYQVIDRTEGLEAAESIDAHTVRELSPADLELLYEKIDPKFFAKQKVAKTAKLLNNDDQPNTNIDLQKMVGDPDDEAISWVSQFKPNKGFINEFDPNSPTEGDDAFVSMLNEGAAVRDKNGDDWLILSYPWQGMVEIQDRWRPSRHSQVSLAAVRRSITMWLEPMQVNVPPPPPGVDYSALPVKIVE